MALHLSPKVVVVGVVLAAGLYYLVTRKPQAKTTPVVGGPGFHGSFSVRGLRGRQLAPQTVNIVGGGSGLQQVIVDFTGTVTNNGNVPAVVGVQLIPLINGAVVVDGLTYNGQSWRNFITATSILVQPGATVQLAGTTPVFHTDVPGAVTCSAGLLVAAPGKSTLQPGDRFTAVPLLQSGHLADVEPEYSFSFTAPGFTGA